jgi:uncharacterized protein (TIGR02145 family)
VSNGWNMIGSISEPIPVSSIQSNPGGMITSEFFGFDNTYVSATTIEPGKAYWVKVNRNGSLILGASSSSCPATVLYDGKTYHTVQIGDQCWLKENLDVGTRIDGGTDQANNSTIEKWCYDNNPMNCIAYGGLYQWNEAMQYSTTAGGQGICPTGWHIPTLAEYQTLGTSVSNNGNALKAIGQGSGDGAGTNTSGFSAMLSGIRNLYGVFNYLGTYTSNWSSTESDASNAQYQTLTSFNSNIMLDNWDKGNGFCVRCVRDLVTSSSLSKASQQGAIKIVATSELPPPPPGEESSSLKEQIPTQYALELNYPNPFNPITEIRYQLPEDNYVVLKVYDVLGKEIATLVNGMQTAGYKSVSFDATTIPSGMYFYRLEATSVSDLSKTFTQVRKMLLVK